MLLDTPPTVTIIDEIDRWMDGWTVGWMDGWMDGYSLDSGMGASTRGEYPICGQSKRQPVYTHVVSLLLANWRWTDLSTMTKV
uniref:Uncharacterized protein n=1 Tax=Vespula pensylvanica TaxID=30213 RepID=A0A834P208_VESPE|nr:hypothetical protein H0235_007813 [Vespula pensylvanica]